MKVRDIRDLSDAELHATIRKLQAEKLQVAGAFAIGTPPGFGGKGANTALMCNIKKDIARCLTIMRERELRGGG